MKTTTRWLLPVTAVYLSLPVIAQASEAPTIERFGLLLARLDTEGPSDDRGAADGVHSDGTSVEEKRAAEGKRRRGALEEIVVTAQRREENLQDVPISVSVMPGAELDASTAQGIAEALNSVPGVATTISYTGGSSTLMVRGVAAAGSTFFGSSPIAYYLDSVPFGFIGHAIVPDVNAYDMERVEVLRGPQGTLYGASAQNGVVRVLTRDADVNEFQFKGRTSMSSTQGGDESYRGDVAINLPIVERSVGVRAVVGYQDLGGWIDRPNKVDANRGEIENFRLKVNAQPTEQLSIGLSSWLSRSDFDAPSQSADGYRNTTVLPEPASSDFDSFGLNVEYDFSAFSIVSMSSYLKFQNDSILDYFSLPLFTGLEAEVLTQEFNLSSAHGGAWRWTAGTIYRDNKQRLIQTFGDFFVVPVDSRARSESFAAFGELTRLLFDGRWELTGGLRYFEDRRSGKGSQAFIGRPDIVDRPRATFDNVSPRAILSWHPSDQATVYASYAEGFRSGGPASTLLRTQIPNFPSLDPDNLKNYEVGSKGSLWNGRMNIDMAVYYIDWEDIQQPLTIVIDGIPFSAMLNGESASGLGVDFGLSIQLVDHLTMGVNFGWNDLEMDADLRSGDVILFDRGDRLNNSPEYLIGAFLDYAFAVGGSGVEGRLSASTNYTSEQGMSLYSAGVLTESVGDTLMATRASLSAIFPKNWVLTLFADNINNERGTPLRDPEGFPEYSVRMRPRTIGLQLEYQFE